MLNKRTFLKIIKLIIDQDLVDAEVSKSLGQVCDGYVMFNTLNSKYDALHIVLKEVMHDKDDWINYWLYELDYGRKAKSNSVTIDGKNIPMRTAEDLFNLLTNYDSR